MDDLDAFYLYYLLKKIYIYIKIKKMSLKVYSTLAGFLGIGLGLIGGFITRDEMNYPS